MKTTWMLLLLTGGLLLAAAAGAEVYRWVDDQGKVHFGDRPPADGAEPVDIQPPPAGAPEPRPATVPDRQRLLDMYDQERQERRAAKQKAARQDAQRQHECRKLANTLRRYEAGGPLFERLPDGGRRYFTAAEKDQEMARIRGVLDKDCGGVPDDLQPKAGR